MHKIILGIVSCLLAGQALAQSLPSDQEFCGNAKDSAYQSGFTTGYTGGYSDGFQDGYTNGYNDSYSDGWDQATTNCQTDPSTCSITVDAVLASGGYGETEPNDNMASADPLIGDVKFIGQTYGMKDQDWYYLVTTEPNQLLTVFFSVPGDAANTGSGWVVEVRNGAGNLYATFTTNPGQDEETVYPVTLGLVGTYYIVVKPAGDSTGVPPNDPYAVAAILRTSDLTNPPLDAKFFDAEVEPNDLYTQATPVSSGVTMYGLVNLTFDDVVVNLGDLDGKWAQGEPDWFVYTTDGNEIINLSFCEKEACEPGDWFVQIFDEAGASAYSSGGNAKPLVAFNTASGQGWPDHITFGLVEPGNYYMLINHKRLFEAPCLSTHKAQNCLNPSGSCMEQVCTFTPDQQPDPPLPDGLSCSCGAGTVCLVSVTRGEEKIDGVCSCADQSLPNCGFADSDYEDVCWEIIEVCDLYGSVVEVDDVTSQYNFTWYGTKTPPFSP